MLVLWHEWGLDVIFREAWEKGTILCGISAGSICSFEQGLRDPTPVRLEHASKRYLAQIGKGFP